MQKSKEYEFQIDAYSPSTIPMSRLAGYMTDLANLFGHEQSVHFVRIKEGSTVVVSAVDFEDVPKVQERLIAVRRHDGPTDAMRAYEALDQKLARDNATGALTSQDGGGSIIKFPGRNRPEPLIYGPIKQQGNLDGILVRIGGVGKMVPVHLMESEDSTHQCFASREIARQLAPYLFGPTLRVYGTGRWYRGEGGDWTMDSFNISSFDVLKDSSLSDAISRLRAIEGSEWAQVDDPLEELRKIRHGFNETI